MGERHGELFDPAAVGAVGCETGVSGLARDRSSIDDPSGGAGNHAVASDGLGQEEDVAQIVFEAEVPIVSDHFGGWFADVAAGLIDGGCRVGRRTRGGRRRLIGCWRGRARRGRGGCSTSEERRFSYKKKGTRDGCLFRRKVSFSGRARLAGSRPAETPFT